MIWAAIVAGTEGGRIEEKWEAKLHLDQCCNRHLCNKIGGGKNLSV